MLATGLGLVDVVGAAAAASTLVAFAQKSMLPMRVSAITANMLFIAYGGMGPFYPVLVLHLVLLPLNVARLIQQLAQRPKSEASPACSLIDEWRRRASDPAP